MKKPKPEPIPPNGKLECDTPAPRVFELPGIGDQVVPGVAPGDGTTKRAKTGGRKRQYKPEFAKVAREMCRMGASDMNLADAFGVHQRTIDYWRISYPEFRTAMKVGKHIADNLVERSLFQRAVGYEYEDTKVFMPAGADTPVAVPIRMRMPGDVKAQIVWLTNRRPEKWREELKVQTAVSVTVKHYNIPGPEPGASATPVIDAAPARLPPPMQEPTADPLDP